MSEITEQRLSSARWTRGEAVVALVGVVWVAAAALWAAPGVLTIDGFVYQAMIDAFARNGSLFIGNGYETYGSDALRLYLMREADGRLTAQYPGGWGILAAPAYALAGLRGVILINALASALTLPLIWVAARALFDSRRIATSAALIYGLATFAVDYAFGVWPHGITTFCVTAGFAAVATGWRGPTSAELRGALLAGLALGIGVNFRVDAVFAAAPLALWLLGAGRRPYASVGALLLGLLPGLAAAATINYLKFGIPSPATYGTDRGATSIGYYAGLAPVALAVMLGALALGAPRVREALNRPRMLALVALGLVAACLVVPPLREIAERVLRGFWVLVVDFQSHPMPALGMWPAEDGTLRTFGVVKKALLQSLPYSAVVLILIPRLWHGPDRAALALCFLFVAVLIVPFAYGTWHGGASKNMRYFLNFLPVLAILTAAALRGILGAAQTPSRLGTVATLAVVAGALTYGALRGYEASYIAEITLPNFIVAAVTTLSLVVLAGPGALRRRAEAPLATLVSIGLVAAGLSGWVVDLRVSQTERATHVEVAAYSRDLPSDALVVAQDVNLVAFRLNRPPALTSHLHFHTGEIDLELADLVDRAFAEGRRVFAQGRVTAERLVLEELSAGFTPRYGLPERFEVYEMAAPEPKGGQ